MLTYKQSIKVCAKQYARDYLSGEHFPVAWMAESVAVIYCVSEEKVDDDIKKILPKVLKEMQSATN